MYWFPMTWSSVLVGLWCCCVIGGETQGITPSPSTSIDSNRLLGRIACGGAVVGSTVGESNKFDVQGSDGPDSAFLFRVDETTRVTFSTCNQNTNFDTKLQVVGSPLSSIKFGFNDDAITGECGVKSILTVALRPATYIVVVDGFRGATGSYTLVMSCEIFSRSSVTASSTRSQTQTYSPTATASSSKSLSQTSSQTPSPSSTQTPTSSSTKTLTQTPSSSATQTPSTSQTQTPTTSSTQSPTQTPSVTVTQTLTQTPSQTSTQSFTQTPSQSPSQSTSSTQTPTRSATPSVSPSRTPSSTVVVTLSLITIFAVGHDTGADPVGSRTFTSGRGIAMAIILYRAVGGATGRFVRFVGTDTLQSPAGGSYQIIQRFRLWSAVASLRLARCPVQTRVQSLSTYLKGRFLAFLTAIPDSPTSLDTETSFSLLLDDVADVECTPPVLSLAVCDPTGRGTVTLCPSPLRARYTLGIVWGNEERPFILENGVTVSMEPFSSSSNPTFVGLSTFTSNIADSSNGLRTGVILNSQIQIVRTLFPECSTTKTVAAGTCASVLATSEVGQGKAAKSSGFCFVPPTGFQNTCGSTSPSNFGCFCDECCYIFGDCCPDVEFCDAGAGVLANECHSSATVVDPTLPACMQLCGTVTSLKILV